MALITIFYQKYVINTKNEIWSHGRLKKILNLWQPVCQIADKSIKNKILFCKDNLKINKCISKYQHVKNVIIILIYALGLFSP